MPWKLIGFLIILTLFIIFAGLNTHPVEIKLGPLGASQIPLFVGLFISFIGGAFISLPFTYISRKKQNKIEKVKKDKNKKDVPTSIALVTEEAGQEETVPNLEEKGKKINKNKKVKQKK